MAIPVHTGETTNEYSNSYKFREELISLINRYSMEKGSNVPDFILADYLMDSLDSINRTNIRRDQWFGNDSLKKERHE